MWADLFSWQSSGGAGDKDAGDDDGQDGAWLPQGHRPLQPRCEGTQRDFKVLTELLSYILSCSVLAFLLFQYFHPDLLQLCFAFPLPPPPTLSCSLHHQGGATTRAGVRQPRRIHQVSFDLNISADLSQSEPVRNICQDDQRERDGSICKAASPAAWWDDPSQISSQSSKSPSAEQKQLWLWHFQPFCSQRLYQTLKTLL